VRWNRSCAGNGRGRQACAWGPLCLRSVTPPDATAAEPSGSCWTHRAEPRVAPAWPPRPCARPLAPPSPPPKKHANTNNQRRTRKGGRNQRRRNKPAGGGQRTVPSAATRLKCRCSAAWKLAGRRRSRPSTRHTSASPRRCSASLNASQCVWCRKSPACGVRVGGGGKGGPGELGRGADWGRRGGPTRGGRGWGGTLGSVVFNGTLGRGPPGDAAERVRARGGEPLQRRVGVAAGGEASRPAAMQPNTQSSLAAPPAPRAASQSRLGAGAGRRARRSPCHAARAAQARCTGGHQSTCCTARNSRTGWRPRPATAPASMDASEAAGSGGRELQACTACKQAFKPAKLAAWMSVCMA
jgi:hypothetical protein